MATVTVSVRVEAGSRSVFDAFTDFASSLKHVPSVSAIEMLTRGSPRPGTRFKKTRLLFGHELTEEVEVLALKPGRAYELRYESLGCEYRETYKFVPEGPATRVELEFNEKAVAFSSKLRAPLSWLAKGLVRRRLEGNLGWIKRWVERHSEAAARIPSWERL